MAKKVVVLWGGNEADVRPFSKAFQDEVKGKFPDAVIDNRYAGGDAGKFPSLLADLAGVDVIVTSGTPLAQAAQKATDKIPIVYAAVGAPNLVNGQNITGVHLLEPKSSGERLQILVDQGFKTVAALWNGANPVHRSYLTAMPGVRAVEVRAPNDLDLALPELLQGQPRPDALIVCPDPMLHSQRARIISFAAKNRLPVMYSQRSFVEQGGLMSYGPNYTQMFAQAAALVNSILNEPGRIPPAEPARSPELVIKGSTAKELGVKIPSGATEI